MQLSVLGCVWRESDRDWSSWKLYEHTHTHSHARRERERGAGRQMMQEGQRLEVCAVKNVRLLEGLGRKTNLQGDPFSKL